MTLLKPVWGVLDMCHWSTHVLLLDCLSVEWFTSASSDEGRVGWRVTAFQVGEAFANSCIWWACQGAKHVPIVPWRDSSVNVNPLMSNQLLPSFLAFKLTQWGPRDGWYSVVTKQPHLFFQIGKNKNPSTGVSLRYSLKGSCCHDIKTEFAVNVCMSAEIREYQKGAVNRVGFAIYQTRGWGIQWFHSEEWHTSLGQWLLIRTAMNSMQWQKRFQLRVLWNHRQRVSNRPSSWGVLFRVSLRAHFCSNYFSVISYREHYLVLKTCFEDLENPVWFNQLLCS